MRFRTCFIDFEAPRCYNDLKPWFRQILRKR
nr:MAG TPA: hypothetical protein [Caudoviricetes sp.]